MPGFFVCRTGACERSAWAKPRRVTNKAQGEGRPNDGCIDAPRVDRDAEPERPPVPGRTDSIHSGAIPYELGAGHRRQPFGRWFMGTHPAVRRERPPVSRVAGAARGHLSGIESLPRSGPGRIYLYRDQRRHHGPGLHTQDGRSADGASRMRHLPLLPQRDRRQRAGHRRYVATLSGKRVFWRLDGRAPYPAGAARRYFPQCRVHGIHVVGPS